MFAAAIAAAALIAHALTRWGAIAAFIVGTLTYGAGGVPFTLILLAFFLPSVALSRVGRARKRGIVDVGKGGARDAWQVLANGGVATVCAVGAGLAGMQTVDARLWIAAFAGAYAAATADTWGTEIGTLMRGAPRSILTWRPIATGLSGGITIAGSIAEIVGAAWIGLFTLDSAVFAESSASADSRLIVHPVFFPVVVGGIVGAVVDSVLGATLQELRYCPTCQRNCEIDPHVCGTPTKLIRGVRGFSNDRVNFAATLSGALGAAVLAAVI